MVFSDDFIKQARMQVLPQRPMCETKKSKKNPQTAEEEIEAEL